MTFERTTDWKLIKTIVCHPKVFPMVSDDGSPSQDEWEPVQHEKMWYVLVRDGEEALGLWMLFPHNAATWDVHTCLLPSAYGERARQAVREFAPWVWENLPAWRVITEVPAYNRLALAFAKKAGMTEFGVNPQSYLHDGKLWDTILLGISKPCQ